MKKIISFLFILFMTGNSVNAQWNNDTLVRNAIAASSGVNEYTPQIIHDGQGGVYVSWGVFNGFGPNPIRVQKIDNAGNFLWTPSGKTVVPAAAGGYSTQLILIPSDSSNGFVTWFNSTDVVKVQRFNSNGDSLFWPHKTVYTAPINASIRELYGIPDDSGGAIIVWKEGGSSVYSLREMRIDKNGNSFWPFSAGLASNPIDVIPDMKNGLYIASYGSGGLPPMYLHHVDRNGINLFPPVFIANIVSNVIYRPKPLAYDPLTGGCYIVYTVDTSYNTFVQFMDSTGALRWPGGGILVGPDNFYWSYQHLVCDDVGGFYLTYSVSNSPDPSHRRFVVKHYDQNGISLWNSADTTIMTLADTGTVISEDGVKNLMITKDNSGGIIITWHEFRNNRLKMYAQRYDSNGNKLWQPNGFPVIAANNTLDNSGGWIRMYHRAIEFGPSSAIVVWQDNRLLTNYDVYCAMIDGVIVTGDNTNASTQNDIIISPNPVRNELIIENRELKTEAVEIYDVMGKKCLTSGVQYSTINVSSLSSGIYFLKIADEKGNKTAKKFIKL